MTQAPEGLRAGLTITDTRARTGEDVFVGEPQWMPNGRVYGGQALAQSLLAAIRTVESDRLPHSMHAYFLRAGDTALPVTYGVDRIHDGRSFSTRRSQAYQQGLPILSMIASFQTADPGVEHGEPMPDAPEPESLASDEELLERIRHPLAENWSRSRPFDIRHVEHPIYAAVEGPRVARQSVWMRAREEMPEDEALHRAAFAYASDYSLLEAALRPHGIAWATPGLKMASLDHAMWWHRSGRVDEWFLYVQESPNAISGRALATGRMYARDGTLIASVAQEGMLRVPDPDGSPPAG